MQSNLFIMLHRSSFTSFHFQFSSALPSSNTAQARKKYKEHSVSQQFKWEREARIIIIISQQLKLHSPKKKKKRMLTKLKKWMIRFWLHFLSTNSAYGSD